MDQIVSRSKVRKVKVYFDDVTIPGNIETWKDCWADTCAVLQALTSAGLMINLRKCKFLVPKAVVLGYQLFEGGFMLASKFLKKWRTLDVPRNTKDL